LGRLLLLRWGGGGAVAGRCVFQRVGRREQRLLCDAAEALTTCEGTTSLAFFFPRCCDHEV